MQVLYKDADNLVKIDELRASASGALVNSATIAAQLYEEDGVTANGSSINLTGSAGLFQGALPASLALVIGAIYFLQITIVASGVNDLRWIKCQCQHHQEIP